MKIDSYQGDMGENARHDYGEYVLAMRRRFAEFLESEDPLVAANSALRAQMKAACDAADIRLYVPEPVLCTDNGAMIAAAAYYKYQKEGADDLELDAYANLPL